MYLCTYVHNIVVNVQEDLEGLSDCSSHKYPDMVKTLVEKKTASTFKLTVTAGTFKAPVYRYITR